MLFKRLLKPKNAADIKTILRRNKLLGEWAVERIGLDGDDAKALASGIIHEDFMEPGDNDLVRYLMRQFAKHDVKIDEEEVRDKFDELLDVARTQLAAEKRR